MLQDGHLVVASEFFEQSVSQRTTMTTAVNKYMTSTNTVYIIPHITTAWNVQLRKNRSAYRFSTLTWMNKSNKSKNPVKFLVE